MIVSILSAVVGLVVLGVTAHATIVATTGYSSAHAYVTLAIAAGVGAAAIAVGTAWSDRRRGVAVWLVIAILAGEAYGLLSTAERLVASREAQQAPLQAAAVAFSKASRRVAEASSALERLPATSPRLEAALAEKRAADAAASEKSAERGCRENCRQLLQARVDTATAEISAARAGMSALETNAKAELQAARDALASLKPPASATPLADRVGVPAWLLDLIAAALYSIAANGLACALIAFAAHRRHGPVANLSSESPIERAAVAAIDVEARRAIPAPTIVGRFAFDRLFPGRADEGVDVRALEVGIQRWCAQRKIIPPSAEELGRAIGDLFADTGIAVEQRGGRMLAMGISLQGEQAALPKPGATIGERLESRRRKQFA